MRKLSTKWTQQELDMLIKLKEEQMINQKSDWKKIAKKLNKIFCKQYWSAKRCRDKYINYGRIMKKQENKDGWNQQEMELLRCVYQQHGSKWSLISSHLPNRSQNQIKNKFHISLKRLVKKINSIQENNQKLAKNKREKFFQNIYTIVEFINQIKSTAQGLNFTINKKCKLFELRQKIIRISLTTNQQIQSEEQKEQLLQLIKNIRNTNTKIRCFGAFKVKNAKKYKLSEKGFHSILSFDNIINESRQKIQEKTSLLKKNEASEEEQSLNHNQQQQQAYNFQLQLKKLQKNQYLQDFFQQEKKTVWEPVLLNLMDNQRQYRQQSHLEQYYNVDNNNPFKI